ncbi:hypothetical protein D9M68_836140 [compost metagenome]
MLRHGQAQQPRLQPQADVEELLHLRARQHGHIGAAVRDHVDQALGAELADGLAHRQAAYSQFLGQQLLAQRGTGGNRARQDAVAQLVDHQFDGGLADEAAGGASLGTGRNGSGKRRILGHVKPAWLGRAAGAARRRTAATGSAMPRKTPRDSRCPQPV